MIPYITVPELSYYAPQAVLPSTTSQKSGLIFQATKMLDAAIGRAEHGLEIHNVYNAPIPLDLNITGVLPEGPFIRWLETTANVIVPGTGYSQQVNLSDFDVEKFSGVIKYQKIIYGGGVWPRKFEPFASLYNETISPYHSGTITQIDDNALPYRMTTSYRSGYFTIVGISASAPSGSTDIEVSDVRDLQVGQEFTFDQDVTLDPNVSTRFITAIDTNTNIVSFFPSTSYSLTTTMFLRRIDTAVKVAVGMLINDLILLPGGSLRSFSVGYGRGALTKSWTRASARSAVSSNIMEIMSPYSI